MTGFAAYTTLLPVLQREWGLSNWEAGLIGGVYYAGYVAATPLLTSLTDRFDPRRIYLASCLVSVIGAAGFALAAQGLAAALVFGVVLDLAGGNQDRAAWGLAFASIGIFGALSPLARWLYLRGR